MSVKPLPLLRKELAIEGAELSGGSYHLLSEDESIDIKVAVDGCRFGVTLIDLNNNAIIATDASLSGGQIALLSYPEKSVVKEDTTAAAPWLIKAASIKLHDVSYSMQMLPYIESLDAHVADAVLSDGVVDMQRYAIDARHLGISGLDCRYIYPDTVIAPADSIPVTDGTVPWTVTGKSVSLTDAHAVYALSGHSPLNGLDMEYIEADSITEDATFVDDLGADSLDIFQIIMGIEDTFITVAPLCACLSPALPPASVADLPSSRLTASSRWIALALPLPT